MAKKIDSVKEKRERNEAYADRFKKKKERDERGRKKKVVPKFANWCRTKGHPPECSCGLPTVEELNALRRQR